MVVDVRGWLGGCHDLTCSDVWMELNSKGREAVAGYIYWTSYVCRGRVHKMARAISNCELDVECDESKELAMARTSDLSRLSLC